MTYAMRKLTQVANKLRDGTEEGGGGAKGNKELDYLMGTILAGSKQEHVPGTESA